MRCGVSMKGCMFVVYAGFALRWLVLEWRVISRHCLVWYAESVVWVALDGFMVAYMLVVEFELVY